MNPPRKLPLLFLVIFCVASTMSCRTSYTNQQNPEMTNNSVLSGLKNATYTLRAVMAQEETNTFMFIVCRNDIFDEHSLTFEFETTLRNPCVSAFVKEDNTPVTFSLDKLSEYSEIRDDTFVAYREIQKDFEHKELEPRNTRVRMIKRSATLGDSLGHISIIVGATAAVLGTTALLRSNMSQSLQIAERILVPVLMLAPATFGYSEGAKYRRQLGEVESDYALYDKYIQKKMAECRKAVSILQQQEKLRIKLQF